MLAAKRNPIGHLPLLGSFCCGCPIALGAKLVLWANLVWCSVVVGLTIASFFSHVGQGAIAFSELQSVFGFAYALAGLPIILVGLGGSVQGLWIYFFYLIGTCFYETFVLIFVVQKAVSFELQGMSLSMSGGCGGFKEYLTPDGENIACILFEAYEGCVVLCLVLFQIYLVWTVWSFIVSVGEPDGHNERQALLGLHGVNFKDALHVPKYPSRIAQFFWGLGCPTCCISCFLRPGMGDFIDGDLTLAREPFKPIGAEKRAYDPTTSAYMNIHGKGLEGATKIFGGPCHDMRYPPPMRY